TFFFYTFFTFFIFSFKAILHVFSAITKETLPIMGPVTLLRSFVSKLKSVVSLQLGIPVSSFRLSTGSHLRLYDCDLLSDYAVQAGKSHLQSRPITDTHTDIIQIKKYFYGIYTCFIRQKLEPLSHRNSGKYKDNVSWDRLIVVHSHLLLVLKLFFSSSIANLACCDPSGRNLLQIAIRHRRRECVTCLASKLYITVSFPGYSLPMYIYLQIKIWICRAQARKRHLLGRKLGDLVHVDGFPMQKKSSNPRGWALRGCIEVKESSCGFPVTSSFVGPSCVCHYPAAPPSQSASVVLPQLHPPQAIKSTRQEQNITRNRACGRKNPWEILPAENTNGSMEDWRSKVPLPHSFPDIRHRHFLISRSSKSDKILDVPQETFKLLNGRTLRENVIYCLAIARLVDPDKRVLSQFGITMALFSGNTQISQKPCRIQPIR
uniref:Ubiquitin-like domain-containing protein n=1 Tax=Cyprinus carpio TaxID=7962 RepID=A0A8C1TNS5_CYPCA